MAGSVRLVLAASSPSQAVVIYELVCLRVTLLALWEAVGSAEFLTRYLGVASLSGVIQRLASYLRWSWLSSLTSLL